MIKSKFKRATSLFLATLMCVTTFAGIGSTTAYAASGEKADVYMVEFPRDGDANYDGVWGHSNLTLKNGWHGGKIKITFRDGHTADRVCKYIDDYHLYVGNCCYHICEFAEKMELNGSKVEPINQSEPSKNKTRNREKQR